jgi:protein involved in polysaccharide export with SLBB domain
MAKPLHRPIVLLTALLAAGCSTGRGGYTLFPEGHRLLDSARAVRQPVAATADLPRELDKRPLPAYTVEPGDVLLVHPADLDSPVRLPGDQPILPDGTISLGRYGVLQVAGKTVPEIQLLVQGVVQAQAQAKDPGPITVRIVARQSKVYYVLGEVNAPGAFPLSGRESVLDGILAAGGLTERASRSDIILSRPTPPGHCRLVLPVCYSEIVQLGDTTTNYQLAPGDRIYVPTRTGHQSLFGKGHKDGCCGGPHTPCLAPDGHAEQAPGGASEVLPPPRLGLPGPSKS